MNRTRSPLEAPLSKLFRRFALVLILTPLALEGAFLAAALVLTHPKRQPPPNPPRDLAIQTVTIQSPSGRALKAWLASPPSPRAAAVLLHGLRADRREMLGRARLLTSSGFAVLMPDLQAHGESEGELITFGHLESRDAIGSVRFMRQRFPGLPVAGIGLSLGGASFVLAGEAAGTDALVLEAAYPTIEQAVDNRIGQRLRLGRSLIAHLLLLQLGPVLGIEPQALRPIEHIGRVNCPVLIISGTDDPLTTQAQTQELLAAASPPRELWLVPGASHQDLLRHSPDAYRKRVLAFLSRHLGVPSPAQLPQASQP